MIVWSDYYRFVAEEVESIGFGCAGGIRINYKQRNFCYNCGSALRDYVDPQIRSGYLVPD